MPAVSKAQQKFFGIVRAIQKGEMAPTSPETAKAAAEMKKKDVKDFASTKHKNLPDKMDVKEIYSGSDTGRAERIKRYDAEKKKFAKDDKRKKFGKFKVLNKWSRYIKENKLNPLIETFTFLLQKKFVDKIVVGVKSKKELNQILNIKINYKRKNYQSFKSNNLNLIDPRKW